MQSLLNPSQAVQWLRARVTGTLQTDSRQVQPGDGFIAWPGGATDGRLHVRDALVRGAAACLVEHEGAAAFALDGTDTATLPRVWSNLIDGYASLPVRWTGVREKNFSPT